MPTRRRVIKRRKRIIRGAGIFGKIWSGLKKAIGYARDKKLVSSVANSIAQATGNPTAARVGAVAGRLGFGRKRKKRVGGRAKIGQTKMKIKK